MIWQGARQNYTNMTSCISLNHKSGYIWFSVFANWCHNRNDSSYHPRRFQEGGVMMGVKMITKYCMNPHWLHTKQTLYDICWVVPHPSMSGKSRSIGIPYKNWTIPVVTFVGKGDNPSYMCRAHKGQTQQTWSLISFPSHLSFLSPKINATKPRLTYSNK